MEYKYIVLIANRQCPADNKHWIKCVSKEQAEKVASNYSKDYKYYADIYELGKML